MANRTVGPAVVYLRVAPQLRQAMRRAADEAGVSMSAWAVHVLASAIGPKYFTGNMSEATHAIPNDVPVTAEDHQRMRALRHNELAEAKSRWANAGLWRGNALAPDEEKLEWFRSVYLPGEGDPDRYKFRRVSGG